MESVRRYSPSAWASAVALSASAWAGHFSFPELSFAAFVLFSVAFAAWIVAKWAGRLARQAPVGESREPAVPRAMSSLALAVFGLYTIAVHAWALVFVYFEPAVNRAYAESMGFEFRPYLLASLVVAVVIAILGFAAIRALGASDPARAASLWLACAVASAGWLAIATVLSAVVARFKAEWSAFGADLPAPTLLLLEFEGYRAFPVALALGLCGLAWFWRSKASFFRWVAVAQLFILVLGSAFFTLAVVSPALPVFKMCGAV